MHAKKVECTRGKQGFRSRSPLSPLARTQIIWRLLGASKSHSWPSRISRVYDGARAASTRVMYTYNIIIQVASMAASTSSSGPVVKRSRISSTERRRFVPAWKIEFPWVVLVEGAMRCQYCQDSGKHNVFTTGCSSLASQPYFSACACPPLPNAHAHVEKYGWLARLGMQ